MRRHPRRVYRRDKRGKSDEELILGQIARWILSGYFNTYSPSKRRQIVDVRNARVAS
ncbi:MAG: hypothetical protein WBA12_08695 [Catalinimonas sp.]